MRGKTAKRLKRAAHFLSQQKKVPDVLTEKGVKAKRKSPGGKSTIVLASMIVHLEGSLTAIYRNMKKAHKSVPRPLRNKVVPPLFNYPTGVTRVQNT